MLLKKSRSKNSTAIVPFSNSVQATSPSRFKQLKKKISTITKNRANVIKNKIRSLGRMNMLLKKSRSKNSTAIVPFSNSVQAYE